MPEYTLTWSIDLSADTPLQAALLAEDIQRDPIWRPVFIVHDDKGNQILVDLEDAEAVA